MFEKTALTTAKATYWLVIGAGALWLTWSCFANLSFGLALVAMPFAFALAALAGAPAAAGIALIAGVVAGLISWISRRLTAPDAA